MYGLKWAEGDIDLLLRVILRCIFPVAMYRRFFLSVIVVFFLVAWKRGASDFVTIGI